jgi:hypothetical protein
LYEARWRQDGDVSSLQGEAVALAARTALPSAIRVRAAIWALIFAANAGDRYCYRVTDRIVQPLLGQTDDREISSVQYELIASTQRGDIEATEVAAGRLVELSTRLVNSAEKTRLLRHAAHGLGLAGKLPEAEEALLSAIDICYEAGAVHSLALCEESLSALQFYRHDIARAHEWANKAEISFRSTEDLHSRQSVSFLQLQIALVENDLPAIHDLLDVIGPVDPDDSNLGRAAVRIASHLRAASAMRVPLVNRSDLMERAVAAISDNPASNVTDFIASAVLYSYADINAKQQGVDFFNRYINSLRLRRGALHLDLAGACSIVSSHSHPN